MFVNQLGQAQQALAAQRQGGIGLGAAGLALHSKTWRMSSGKWRAWWMAAQAGQATRQANVRGFQRISRGTTSVTS